MIDSNNVVVAVDGPAASGKSTIAKAIAERLEYDYLDTGAMYRAVTLKVLQDGVDPHDEASIAIIAASHTFSFDTSANTRQKRIFIDGEDVSGLIRTPEVNAAVSAVSQVPRVRQLMVKAQQEFAVGKNVVVEGRDIGTVVFPSADLKVFLVASPYERARRRQIDLKEQGVEVDMATLERQIIARDEKDRNRRISPLIKAQDAVVVDTTEKSVSEVVDEIVETLERRLAKGETPV